MGLEILGNQINNNGNHAIQLTALEGYVNPVPPLPPPALPLVTLGAIIHDNMMENNHSGPIVLGLCPDAAERLRSARTRRSSRSI